MSLLPQKEEFPEDSISTSQSISTYLLYFCGLFLYVKRKLLL